MKSECAGAIVGGQTQNGWSRRLAIFNFQQYRSRLLTMPRPNAASQSQQSVLRINSHTGPT
jgi:hypothetical protein